MKSELAVITDYTIDHQDTSESQDIEIDLPPLSSEEVDMLIAFLILDVGFTWTHTNTIKGDLKNELGNGGITPQRHVDRYTSRAIILTRIVETWLQDKNNYLLSIEYGPVKFFISSNHSDISFSIADLSIHDGINLRKAAELLPHSIINFIRLAVEFIREGESVRRSELLMDIQYDIEHLNKLLFRYDRSLERQKSLEKKTINQSLRKWQLIVTICFLLLFMGINN